MDLPCFSSSRLAPLAGGFSAEFLLEKRHSVGVGLRRVVGCCDPSSSMDQFKCSGHGAPRLEHVRSPLKHSKGKVCTWAYAMHLGQKLTKHGGVFAQLRLFAAHGTIYSASRPPHGRRVISQCSMEALISGLMTLFPLVFQVHQRWALAAPAKHAQHNLQVKLPSPRPDTSLRLAERAPFLGNSHHLL